MPEDRDPEPTPGAPPPALLTALRRMLRPLVRLLLHHNLQYGALTSLLKELYVEVASSDFPLEGKGQTDSRVSLLSGVHRKEVRRLRAEPAAREFTPPAVTLGAQLVLLWTTSPRYRDRSGHARPLPRSPERRGEPSFEELVASINTDIRPRSVLDEWLRLGVAHLDEKQRVCLNAEAFVPAHGFDEKAFYFGRNLRDHIAAAAHNLRGEGAPFFERSVHYGELPDEAVDELQALASELGMDALQRVNRRAAALKRSGARRKGKRSTIAFGAYFFREPASDDAGGNRDEE
jgi:hypothetical protein